MGSILKASVFYTKLLNSTPCRPKPIVREQGIVWGHLREHSGNGWQVELEYRTKLHCEKEAVTVDYLSPNSGECGRLGKEIKLAITQQGTIEGSWV